MAKYVFSYLKHLLPESINIFTCTGGVNMVNVYYTRQHKANKLKIPKARTCISTRSITSMGPKIWNSIDPKLYQKTTNESTFFVSMKCFVSKYKNTFINNYQ